MRVYKGSTKRYLIPMLKPWRKARGLTQENMAEKLRMSSRSYAALERGESGLSATTLLFFLAELSDEELLQVVRGFLNMVILQEQQGAA